MAPGSQVEYTVEAKAIEERISSFSGYGTVDGQKIVEARFRPETLQPVRAEFRLGGGRTARVTEAMKDRYKLLSQQN